MNTDVSNPDVIEPIYGSSSEPRHTLRNETTKNEIPGASDAFARESNLNSSPTNDNTVNGSPVAVPQPGEAVEHAKQHAQRMLEQTQRSAGEAIGQARVRTTSWIETQLDQVADGLGQVAQSVRKSGEQLRTQDPQNFGQIVQLTNSAADSVEGASNRLRDATVDEIHAETEKLARTQPGAFLGGAFVAGFLLARFLKSSSADSNDVRK